MKAESEVEGEGEHGEEEQEGERGGGKEGGRERIDASRTPQARARKRSTRRHAERTKDTHAAISPSKHNASRVVLDTARKTGGAASYAACFASNACGAATSYSLAAPRPAAPPAPAASARG